MPESKSDDRNIPGEAFVYSRPPGEDGAESATLIRVRL